VNWDTFVEQATATGHSGVECLSGIPGTIGGTPVQNVGAYGQDVSETIAAVDALDLNSFEFVEFRNADCGFAYRTSRFNSSDRGRYMILQVRFCLKRDSAPAIKYADLKAYFSQQTPRPSLTEVRRAVLEIRRRKAMLVEDSEPDSRSAGSFFKNPLVSNAQYEQIAELWLKKGVAVPKFAANDGRVKIPAGWLVEQSGLPKGFQLGPAAISRRHALAIVNRGGATAADILKLKELIQARVYDTFGVRLQVEPVFVGFEANLTPAQV